MCIFRLACRVGHHMLLSSLGRSRNLNRRIEGASLDLRLSLQTAVGQAAIRPGMFGLERPIGE